MQSKNSESIKKFYCITLTVKGASLVLIIGKYVNVKDKIQDFSSREHFLLYYEGPMEQM